MIESTIKARGKPKVKLPSLKQEENKKWEDLFAFHLQTAGMGKLFIRQYIIPGLRRKWPFDFCDPHPDRKICIEVQGGIWSRGKSGHTSGSGIKKDHEKYNHAQAAGYKVFQITSDTIQDMSAIDFIVKYYREHT